jgi:N utilization substance protein B
MGLKMGNRRRARELAMQALFYMDMRQDDSSEMLDHYCQCFAPSKKILPFFLQLVEGVLDSKPELDAIIENFSSNWKVYRMSCVDRNVMRIAVYELMFCDEIPSKVSINEAVDVGKKFGTEESGAFINGILDSIRLAMEEDQFPLKTEVKIPPK